MTIDTAIRGSLFAPDFLTEPESIGELPEWDDLDAATLDKGESRLRAVFEAFPHQGTPNESQTEDDLIWKTLYCLDWTAHLRARRLRRRLRVAGQPGPGQDARRAARRVPQEGPPQGRGHDALVVAVRSAQALPRRHRGGHLLPEAAASAWRAADGAGWRASRPTCTRRSSPTTWCVSRGCGRGRGRPDQSRILPPEPGAGVGQGNYARLVHRALPSAPAHCQSGSINPKNASAADQTGASGACPVHSGDPKMGLYGQEPAKLKLRPVIADSSVSA